MRENPSRTCFWSVWPVHHVLSNALFLCSHWSRNGPSVEGTGVKVRRATQRSSSPGKTLNLSGYWLQTPIRPRRLSLLRELSQTEAVDKGVPKGNFSRLLQPGASTLLLLVVITILRRFYYFPSFVVSQNIAKTSHNRQTKQQGEVVSGKTGSDEGKNRRSCIDVPSVD